MKPAQSSRTPSRSWTRLAGCSSSRSSPCRCLSFCGIIRSRHLWKLAGAVSSAGTGPSRLFSLTAAAFSFTCPFSASGSSLHSGPVSSWLSAVSPITVSLPAWVATDDSHASTSTCPKTWGPSPIGRPQLPTWNCSTASRDPLVTSWTSSKAVPFPWGSPCEWLRSL